MSALHSIAVGLTRRWAATYTRGLPDEVKAERRSEIDCDLWEQQRYASLEGESGAATGTYILTRCILGMASDISWRAEAGSAARQEGKVQVTETLVSRLVFGVALVVVILPILMGATTVVDAGVSGASADEDAADNLIFGAVSMLAGGVMVTGLLLSRSSPRVGVPVLAVGVIGIFAFWYWMFIITVPVGIALIAIAYFRARQFGWPRGTGAA